jgi:large subunit ribosomal protein L28
MTWRCDLLSEYSKQKGNMVSHSNRKKIKHFKANLQTMEFFSDALNKSFRLRVAVKTNRTIVKCGSFDEFLMSRPASEPGNGRSASKILSPLGLKIRRAVKKKLSETKGK